MSEASAWHTLNVTGLAQSVYKEGRTALREQRYADAVKYFTHALQVSGNSDLFNARVLEYRGACHWLMKSFDAAEQDYEASFAESQDQIQQARAEIGLGNVADARGLYEGATVFFQNALHKGETAVNSFVIGRALRGLGIVQRRQGNTEAAIDHLTQALIAFRQTGEAREQGRVFISLGRTRQARGEYQQALTAQREALTIFESLNDRWRIAQALNDLGESHQALYDFVQAMAYHEKALTYAIAHQAKLLKPEIERNLGVDLIELGRMDEGLAYLQAACRGAHEIGYREQEALSLYNLSRAYLRQNEMALAKTAVEALSQMAEALDADRYRALAAFVWGELLFLQGEVDKAIEQLNAATLAAQTSVDRGVLWKLHATIGHVVENEAIAAVHLNIAAEFLRQTAEPLQDEAIKSQFVNAPPVLAVLQAAGIDPEKL